MLCRWIDDEINVLSSHFPVSVNNVRSPLSITKRKKERKKSVDIIDLDLIEERRRRRKIFPSFVPLLLLKRERRLIITCRIGAAERQVRTDIYTHTYIRKSED
jgi:NADH:ubiquinone oxidoreductase subunit C